MAQLKANSRIYGNAIIDSALTVNGGNAATSYGTGALVVTGGLGMTGAAYIAGGIQNTPIGNLTASTGGFTTVTAAGLSCTTFGSNSTGTVSGAWTFNSTLSAASTISLTGAINSITSLGTAATTGTLTLGGTGQSGTITLGQSTGTHTLSIDSGVTAAASVKTITLGTAGAAGSNTTITIGPTLGFGTATFALNTNVIVNNTAISTSATTGALNVAGGIGVGGNVYVTGNVVTPNRPAFRVYGNTSTVFVGIATITNQAVDYNKGNYYDNTTGIFTVPIAGLYHCAGTVRVSTYNGVNQAAFIKNNNTSGANVIAFWEVGNNTSATHFSLSGYANCAVGDTIRLQAISGNIGFDSNDSWGVTFIG